MVAHAKWGTPMLVAILVALVGCAAPGQPAPSTAASSPPQPTLNWTDCGNGLQCTQLDMPRDYADPTSGEIQIALLRKPATDGAAQGSVVVNAGTQNGGGAAFVQAFPQVTADMNRTFDVIGLDTRGVGESRPLVSCVTYEELHAIEAPLSAAQVPADRDIRIREAAELTAQCPQRSSGLLPHLSSATSARDLDRVRIALGEDRLRIVGVSGGAVLAQQYLRIFPERVHSVVLDSPFDAEQFTEDPFAFDVDQMVATEATMGTFFTWCAATPSSCTFGDGDPRGAFMALKARAAQNRIDNPGRWDVLTDGLLVDMISGGMLFPAGWPELATKLTALAASPDLPAPLGAGDDRGFAEYYSQTCLDRGFPTDPAAYDAQLARAVTAAPIIGGRYGYAEFKCHQWPVRAAAAPAQPWTNSGGRPVLVVTADDDPLAPHRGALTLAQRLGAPTIIVDTSGHIQLGRTPCVDAPVTAFLLTGVASATTCSMPLPGGAR